MSFAIGAMPQTTDADPLGEESVFIWELVEKCSDSTLSECERDHLRMGQETAVTNNHAPEITC